MPPIQTERDVRDRGNALLGRMMKVADAAGTLAWILRDDDRPETRALVDAIEAARVSLLEQRSRIVATFAVRRAAGAFAGASQVDADASEQSEAAA